MNHGNGVFLHPNGASLKCIKRSDTLHIIGAQRCKTGHVSCLDPFSFFWSEWTNHFCAGSAISLMTGSSCAAARKLTAAAQLRLYGRRRAAVGATGGDGVCVQPGWPCAAVSPLLVPEIHSCGCFSSHISHCYEPGKKLIVPVLLSTVAQTVGCVYKRLETSSSWRKSLHWRKWITHSCARHVSWRSRSVASSAVDCSM